MSNNELSSVEFYAKAEKDLSDRFSLRQVNYTQYREKKRELLEQAKAMHKEEIEQAFYEGNHNSVDYFNMEDFRIKDYEQYYNETFNK